MEHNTPKSCLRLLTAPLDCAYKTLDDSPIESSLSHFALHNHDGYELYLFLDGDVNFYTETSSKKLTRGDLLCIPPYVFHGSVLMSPSRHSRIVLNMTEGYLRSLCSPATDLSLCLHSSDSTFLIAQLPEETIVEFKKLTDKLQTALSSKEWGSDLLCSAILTQLLIMLGNHVFSTPIQPYAGIMPPLVMQTFSYVEEHLTEEITLQKLSETFHHNGTYVSRCFKNATGTPLFHYILSKRLTLAKQYLRRGLAPTEVCFQCGFQNYSNFSRSFRHQFGCSPKQYQDNSGSSPLDPDMTPAG